MTLWLNPIRIQEMGVFHCAATKEHHHGSVHAHIPSSESSDEMLYTSTL